MTTLPDIMAPLVALEARSEDDAEVRAAFTLLYRRQAPRVHRFLRDLLRDGTLALDATQETFARVLEHPKMVCDPARAVPWVFGVARNVSLEMRRARTRSARLLVASCDGDADVERSNVAGTGTSPERDLLGREALRVLDAALAKLSEDRRALVLLRLDHGFSYEDIATSMGFSLAKVKVELHRAREELRLALERYDKGTSR